LRSTAESSVRVVEVESTLRYDQGHVPGAAGRNWTTELCDAGRDIVPAAKSSSCSARPASTTNRRSFCRRQQQLVHAAGVLAAQVCGDDVRIMDGRRKKWLAETRDKSTDKASFRRTIRPARRICRARSFGCSRPFQRRSLVDVRSPQNSAAKFWPPGCRNVSARRLFRRKASRGAGNDDHVQELRRAEGAMPTQESRASSR
jgi:thiosulfate/3-mercaptopyruvate sulfurtransferase